MGPHVVQRGEGNRKMAQVGPSLPIKSRFHIKGSKCRVTFVNLLLAHPVVTLMQVSCNSRNNSCVAGTLSSPFSLIPLPALTREAWEFNSELKSTQKDWCLVCITWMNMLSSKGIEPSERTSCLHQLLPSITFTQESELPLDTTQGNCVIFRTGQPGKECTVSSYKTPAGHSP